MKSRKLIVYCMSAGNLPTETHLKSSRQFSVVISGGSSKSSTHRLWPTDNPPALLALDPQTIADRARRKIPSTLPMATFARVWDERTRYPQFFCLHSAWLKKIVVRAALCLQPKDTKTFMAVSCGAIPESSHRRCTGQEDRDSAQRSHWAHTCDKCASRR